MFHQNSPPTLVIEDLPPECGEADVLLMIQPFGRVKSLNITYHPQKHNSIVATAEFYVPSHGENARVNLDGTIIMGRKIM